MKTIINLVLWFLFLGLICQGEVKAQILVPYSVLGNGGGELTGGQYNIHGTVGQPAIGSLASASVIQETGFWYLPDRITTSVATGPEKGLPTEYRLEQNYPNPFNPVTTIQYQIPVSGQVKLFIYNLSGQKIRTLVNENKSAGIYHIQWDAKDNMGDAVASGVYVYRIKAEEFVQSRIMLLLR